MAYFKPLVKKVPTEFKIPPVITIVRDFDVSVLEAVQEWHSKYAEAASEKRDHLRHNAIIVKIQEELDAHG